MTAVKQMITDRVTERLERLKQSRIKLEQVLEKIANDSSIYDFSKALKEIKQVEGDIEATEAALDRRLSR